MAEDLRQQYITDHDQGETFAEFAQRVTGLARQLAARDWSNHKRTCALCLQGRYCDTVRTLDAAYRQATEAEYASWGG